MKNKRTALYRHFDENDNLLYVGISLSVSNRLYQHQKYAKWFSKVNRVDVEWFESREFAEQAELAAIKSENPKFNIAHNQKTRSSINAKQKRKVKYLPSKMREFYEFSINEKQLIIACITLEKSVRNTLSLCGKFTITTRYFSTMFDTPIDKAFDEMVNAANYLMESRCIDELDGSNEQIEYRIYKTGWLSSFSIDNEEKTVALGFNCDTDKFLLDIQGNDYFLTLLDSINLADSTGCTIECWDEYLDRIFSERDRKAEAYLEKHNSVGLKFDAIYCCKGTNPDCEMGSFFAPSSMKNNPPPCEDCGGETVFDSLY